MTYWCEHAVLPGGVVAGVLVEVDGERFGSVTAAAPPPDATVLRGLTVPGLANAHSHAFHRALRGRTHEGGGDFWSWREAMYAVAEALDPDTYLALARATFAEMALAGITCVGEFHYLHHGRGGTPYADPNAMGHAVAQAAREAGIRITVLDTCYLAGGFGPSGGQCDLTQPQLRFSDGDVGGWLGRVSRFDPGAGAKLGAAVHSVRAVPARDIEMVAEWAARGAVLHAHVSEQAAENAACLAAHGRTPTALLYQSGALASNFTAVHGTHLTAADIDLYGLNRATVCFCPTTERDLADGIGPASALRAAGASLSLGSDSHAVIDLFEEARGVELDERLITGRRGGHSAADLLAAATEAGHACLGWRGVGRIEAGAYADLVTISLDTPRTAGCPPTAATAVFAATAADVRHVVASGRVVVADGVHQLVPDVPAALSAAIGAVIHQ
ncbi:formimidoylglutamate deiminase [Sporichthya sp.]|uniref:formimidoylglutamate deiminase n=1 Tax=Sporichthya sp. TaxID=65475 RepID=UPI00184721A4|nr:formimidoylglutamate deiminase [Sporichthya sp.]MBA3742075.1 formimidoylglutamate deiminase [Sporichthya sp.]